MKKLIYALMAMCMLTMVACEEDDDNNGGKRDDEKSEVYGRFLVSKSLLQYADLEVAMTTADGTQNYPIKLTDCGELKRGELTTEEKVWMKDIVDLNIFDPSEFNADEIVADMVAFTFPGKEIKDVMTDKVSFKLVKCVRNTTPFESETGEINIAIGGYSQLDKVGDPAESFGECKQIANLGVYTKEETISEYFDLLTDVEWSTVASND